MQCARGAMCMMTLLESGTTSLVITGSDGKCLVACSGVTHERSIDELIPSLLTLDGSFKK